MSEQLPIPILAGPTASGKTRISLDLALHVKAEIISADSRQIFRGLQIGTASPTTNERETVPHHFVQELDAGESYSAGIFTEQAADRISQIHDRGKNVVVAGGSTLYVQALLQPFADIPHIDPSVRLELNLRLEKVGSLALFNELVDVDPTYSNTLDPSKSQRIVRGLEVFYGSGQPLSSFFSASPSPSQPFKLFVLFREREILYQRINERVDKMMEEGLLEEASNLYKQDAATRALLEKTIGYQELLPYLGGTQALDVCVDLIKRNSRRYAKRQLTWYKRFEDARWIDLGKHTNEEVTSLIASRLKD